MWRKDTFVPCSVSKAIDYRPGNLSPEPSPYAVLRIPHLSPLHPRPKLFHPPLAFCFVEGLPPSIFPPFWRLQLRFCMQKLARICKLFLRLNPPHKPPPCHLASEHPPTPWSPFATRGRNCCTSGRFFFPTSTAALWRGPWIASSSMLQSSCPLVQKNIPLSCFRFPLMLIQTGMLVLFFSGGVFQQYFSFPFEPIKLCPKIREMWSHKKVTSLPSLFVSSDAKIFPSAVQRPSGPL